MRESTRQEYPAPLTVLWLFHCPVGDRTQLHWDKDMWEGVFLPQLGSGSGGGQRRSTQLEEWNPLPSASQMLLGCWIYGNVMGIF